MKEIIKHYLKPYYLKMGIGFIIKFIGTIMDLCIPYILAHIIDTIIPMKQENLISFWGMLMVGCSILAVSFNVIANRMASKVSRDVTENIRHDLFSKTIYLSNSQTDTFTKPSLISRMTTDTYNLHQMLGRVQRLGVRAPILLVGGIFVTFTLDVSMACVLVAILPILGFITVYVSRKSIPMYASLQEATDRFVRMVREDISGIRVIKALSRTNYETNKFKEINKEVVERERKNGMVMAIINPTMNILLNFGLIGVILVGAFKVNNGTTEVGKILAFTTYFTIILNAMMSISRMFVVLSKSVASGNRIWQVLESKDEMKDIEKIYQNLTEESNNIADEALKTEKNTNKKSAELHNITQQNRGTSEALLEENVSGTYTITQQNRRASEENIEIEFQNVSFSYLKGKDADVSNLNFRIKKGETLGIIGEIGSGKSTIINLLMRLYDVSEGSVRVSGKDVRSYPVQELRRKFGVVFQNDTIFEDTIAGNVTLGRELTKEQVQEALFYAKASEFVEKREGKETESVNIKGANLSGGQKQRVLIARALAAKPEILILDDSSSALDYRTDASLRKGIKEHFVDTTLVIVAQRVSSIHNADHILVLEEGKMKGYGTHEELMESCEIYREISKSQMGEIEETVKLKK